MANGLDRLAIFKKSGSAAVVRPLGAIASMLTRMQGSLYQAPEDFIPGMKSTDFPSPLQPVRPFGPPDAQPLGINMQMGQNLIFTPRPDSRYTAADLQALARYPLARMCIDNVINTISSLKWKIQLRAQPGEDTKAREAKQLKDDTIFRLTDFMNSPDGEHDFKDWVHPLIDDMLRIDAGCYLMRRTPDQTVYEWRVMQGAYITRYVDANGYTPLAPAPAYVQIWDGIPRINLNVDQLIYKPRNIVYELGNVASSLYGLSQTEAIAPEIEVGIQRLRYVTAFYKDGSIPNVLWVVPADASPDTVTAAMNYLNADMSGNLESRRMFRMAQGFRSSDSQKEELIKQFEEPKLSDEYDDLHTRRVCFSYGVSAQRLLRMMTRATATTNQEAAEEEGIAPSRQWTEDTINWGIQRKMGFQKYEFKFDISQDPDPTKQSEIDATDLGSGIATVNEKRIARGWDPRQEPEADKLGKWIATGWVSIDQVPQAPAGSGGAPPTTPKPKTAADDDDDEPHPPAGKGKQKVAKSADAEPAILDPGRDTIRSRAAKASLFAKIYHFFHTVKSTMVIVDPHTHTFSSKVRKADDPEPGSDEQIEQIVEAIMGGIPWKSLPAYIQDAISEAAEEGAAIGLDQSERMIETPPAIPTPTPSIEPIPAPTPAAIPAGRVIVLSPTPVRVITTSVISDVNQVAVDYAKKRAAELVGMKWVDGQLVQNPNAAMAISDSTRNMLREIIADAFERETPMNQLTQRIQDAGVFSQERAQLIADTETKFAMARGNLEAWIRTGVVKSVKSVLSMLHEGDDECDDNAEAGPIPVGEAFPSGDVASPFHPRCRCTMVAVELVDPTKKKAA